MSMHRDLVSEADARSRQALDSAVRCIDIASREPLFAPVMIGCSLCFAGFGVAIAGTGILAGLLRAAQVGAETENTSAP